MSYFGRLGWTYALKPHLRTIPPAMHNFMVIGGYSPDDDHGTVPPDVTRETQDLSFSGLTACSYHPTRKRLVLASEVADRQFSYSDSAGSDWQGSSVSGFEGYVERIFYIADKDMFIGLAADGSNARILISFDGAVWSIPQVPAIIGETFGFAYSGGVFVVSYGTDGQNMLRSADGLVWSKISSGLNAGMSLLWHPATSKFMGFLDGTNQYYTSTDGITWSGPSNGPDILDTPFSVAEAGGDRIVVVGTTRNLSYSDDDGNTWADASGFTTNAGEASRYIAISGDTIYVALKVQINLGFLSEDNGATWQTAYHLSGNVSGVAVVA